MDCSHKYLCVLIGWQTQGPPSSLGGGLTAKRTHNQQLVWESRTDEAQWLSLSWPLIGHCLYYASDWSLVISLPLTSLTPLSLISASDNSWHLRWIKTGAMFAGTWRAICPAAVSVSILQTTSVLKTLNSSQSNFRIEFACLVVCDEWWI